LQWSLWLHTCCFLFAQCENFGFCLHSGPNPPGLRNCSLWHLRSANQEHCEDANLQHAKPAEVQGRSPAASLEGDVSKLLWLFPSSWGTGPAWQLQWLLWWHNCCCPFAQCENIEFFLHSGPILPGLRNCSAWHLGPESWYGHFEAASLQHAKPAEVQGRSPEVAFGVLGTAELTQTNARLATTNLNILCKMG